MRIDQFDALAATARQRLGLGFLHGVQYRVEQVQRDHYQDFCQGIGALQLPRNPGGVPRQLFRARLRIHPVCFDITSQADMAHRVRVGIGVFEVGAMPGIRVGKDDFRAYLEAGADSLCEWVGRLDRYVDGLISAAVLIGVEDNRDFGKARNRAHPGGLERSGQFQGDDLRAVAQDGRAHFDGEFQAPRDHRKIREAATRQAARIRNRKVDFSGHNVKLPLPAPG